MMIMRFSVFMKNIHDTLNRIESLLAMAEQELENDGGRHSPPPVVPKNRRHWAKDNSGAVDPDDYESCKEFVLRNVTFRPHLRPGMFCDKLADECASTVSSKPGTWSRLERNHRLRNEAVRTSALAECHKLCGMKLQAKYNEKDGRWWLLWSGEFTRQCDSRQMTHAQRLRSVIPEGDSGRASFPLGDSAVPSSAANVQLRSTPRTDKVSVTPSAA